MFGRYTVVDPGFPVGGREPPTWALLAKMCAKMKELGPIGGCAPGTPPRSANGIGVYWEVLISLLTLTY